MPNDTLSPVSYPQAYAFPRYLLPPLGTKLAFISGFLKNAMCQHQGHGKNCAALADTSCLCFKFQQALKIKVSVYGMDNVCVCIGDTCRILTRISLADEHLRALKCGCMN